MSNYYKNSEYFTKKKSRAAGDRENFLQLYDRTCHRIYYYAFECSGSVHDADVIARDAFIYMYEHIAELRTSKSLDTWQKECVQKAFRALLRSQLLTLIRDGSHYTAASTLPESKKDELWNSITKMSDIDPWRMVPVPGRSSIFSVLADQTISDLRYMTIGEIVKSAATILAIAVAVIAAVYFGVSYIKKAGESKIGGVEEIFLDERYYDDFDLSSANGVDNAKVDEYLTAAGRYDKDEEGNIIAFTSPEPIGSTEGLSELTDDMEINARLGAILDEVTKDDMTDREVLEAIYNYVGSHMEYLDNGTEYDSKKDQAAILGECLDSWSGTSQHYAVLIAALYNAAGYHCEVIEGSFILNRDTEFERPVRHWWNKVALNGIIYYVDLEADCDENGSEVRKFYFLAADGNPRWEIFDRDHEEN